MEIKSVQVTLLGGRTIKANVNGRVSQIHSIRTFPNAWGDMLTIADVSYSSHLANTRLQCVEHLVDAMIHTPAFMPDRKNFVAEAITLKRSKRAWKYIGKSWSTDGHALRLFMALTANRCERCLETY